MSRPQINLKRVYEPPSTDDGLRILVERLWPRGLSKAEASIDHWVKDIAPTPQLRTWFAHRADRWEAFRRRYRSELRANREAVEALKSLCAGQKATFVYAARDVERNGAVVLREFILSGSH